ncbi:MAG TPA: hypothetical protein VMT53_20545 [Terriglobales bacterium]|nr:hypothetical protein [Terriglobales bacterium]
MLLHQFIVVVTAWARRFDAVLLHGIAVARRVASRVKLTSDLQDA